MNHARTVDVGGEIPYTIAIGPGLLGDGEALARHVRGRHVLLVSDSVVAPLYAGTVREALHTARPDLAIGTFILPAGEESKTLAHFGHAIEALATLGATRDACVQQYPVELFRLLLHQHMRGTFHDLQPGKFADAGGEIVGVLQGPDLVVAAVQHQHRYANVAKPPVVGA